MVKRLMKNNTLLSPKTINALTFDERQDGWEASRGFIRRSVPMPLLDEEKNPADALAVIIKVRFAGMCGTDRGIWNRAVFRDVIHHSLAREKKTLRILGHEFVGTVIAAGSQVERLYGIHLKDDVSGDSHVTCGRCFQCRIGEEEVCQDQAILGISTDGVFAPFVKIPAKNLWVVDFARIRPEIAAMFDPFGNAVHAVSKVDVRGKRVAVLGCGPIGLFTILLAHAFGAVKILAVDTNGANLAMARRLGAHATFQLDPMAGKKSREPARITPDAGLLKAIDSFTYGKGVDVAFEMAGPNSSVANAVAITRGGGAVVLFGLKDGDFTLPDFNRAIVKGLTLYGVIGRQIFTTWQTAQRVLADRTNGIQDAIWNTLLKKGRGSVVPFAAWTPERWEELMRRHPKLLIKF